MLFIYLKIEHHVQKAPLCPLCFAPIQAHFHLPISKSLHTLRWRKLRDQSKPASYIHFHSTWILKLRHPYLMSFPRDPVPAIQIICFWQRFPWRPWKSSLWMSVLHWQWVPHEIHIKQRLSDCQQFCQKWNCLCESIHGPSLLMLANDMLMTNEIQNMLAWMINYRDHGTAFFPFVLLGQWDRDMLTMECLSRERWMHEKYGLDFAVCWLSLSKPSLEEQKMTRRAIFSPPETAPPLTKPAQW